MSDEKPVTADMIAKIVRREIAKLSREKDLILCATHDVHPHTKDALLKCISMADRVIAETNDVG